MWQYGNRGRVGVWFVWMIVEEQYMGVLDRDTPPYRIDAGREDLGIPHNMGAWRCAVEAFVSEASLSRQQCVIRKTHLSQPVQSTNSRKSDIVFLLYWSEISTKTKYHLSTLFSAVKAKLLVEFNLSWLSLSEPMFELYIQHQSKNFTPF